MQSPPHLQQPLSGVVVVVLADFLRQHRGWGWLRLVAGATPYKNVPGLTSVKVSKKNKGLMKTKPNVMAAGTQPAMK